jgi:hypothetical protein
VTIMAGDIGWAHTNGLMGKLIRIGESLRGKRGSEWNHQFIVGSPVPDEDDWYVIQATIHGVTDTGKLSEFPKYVTKRPPKEAEPAKILLFARTQVGVEYGFFTIFGIAIDIVTWDWFPSFRGARKQSWICSALVEEALRFAGWLHDFVNIYAVTPQDGWDALNP